METLQQLFETTVRDLYSAEYQFMKALPKLMKAARDSQLKAAIETNLSQCEEHLVRLERLGVLGGFSPKGKTCQVAQGQVEETWKLLEHCVPGPTMDAAIISCLQKAEHYELCSYGTLLAWAETMGDHKAIGVLRQCLLESCQNDELLSAIAEEVNASSACATSVRRIETVKEMVESIA